MLNNMLRISVPENIDSIVRPRACRKSHFVKRKLYMCTMAQANKRIP